jgi:Mg-chelatase subunit ChlD/plastocyanin
MRAGKGFVAVILFVILVLSVVVFYPKAVQSARDNAFRYCSCLGLAYGDVCFGIPKSCTTIKFGNKESEKGTVRQGIDIAFIIDKSASMNSTKIAEAKKAAGVLVDMMSGSDRMAIIAFDNSSSLLQDFTSNKAVLKGKIESIKPSGATKYLPALNTAFFNFLSASPPQPGYANSKKIIFLSDGEPQDMGGREAIYTMLGHVTGSNICTYTVGYGNLTGEGDTVEILSNMASVSRSGTGCGRYYWSDADSAALGDVFSSIYTDLSNTDLVITLSSPENRIYRGNSVPVSYSTNVPAFCSYTLNSGNLIEVNAQNFSIDAPNGMNRLKIRCERFFGKQQTKEKEVSFAVLGEKKGIKSIVSSIFESRERVSLPQDAELEDIIGKAIAQEEFSVIRKMIPYEGGTKVVVLVQNTKPVQLDNLKARQYFPEGVAQLSTISEAESGFAVIQEMPAIIEFSLGKARPEGIISFSYLVNKSLSQEELDSIKTEISFDSISDDQIKQLVSAQNNTQAAVDITRRTINEDGKTKSSISIMPKNRLSKANVYLQIPKCMAERLNEVYFRDSNYRIISDDPVVMWNFAEINEKVDIEIETDANSVDEDCKKKLLVVPITEKVENALPEKESGFAFLTFLPLILMPLLIMLFIADKTYLEKNYRKTSTSSKVIIIVLFAGIMLAFLYPKPRDEAKTECSCFGIDAGSLCYGQYTGCSERQAYIEKAHNVCSIQSCEEYLGYFRLGNGNEYLAQATDLTIVIDRSGSMKGEKMQQAKEASISLLSKISEKDRVAIVMFDNSSQLVQQFTSEKPLIIDSLNSIEVGGSTEYIPPLKSIGYNYLFNGDSQNRKLIIFLTDGAPQDIGRPESIYDAVRELANQGICINTIGYGHEISQGSDAEKILKGMAEISTSITGCGNYYYSPKEITALTQSLEKAYSDYSKQEHFVKISSGLENYEMSSTEALFFDVRATTTRDIPNLGCTMPLAMSLEISDGKNWINEPLYYDADTNRYYTGSKTLAEGAYNIAIVAQATADGKKCGLNETMDLGRLQVVKPGGQLSCPETDCGKISQYLNSEQQTRVIKAYVSENGFSPQNISITDRTTVIWTNTGNQQHTVTSGEDFYDGLFNSGILEHGQSFNFTFEAGVGCFFFDNISIENRGMARGSGLEGLGMSAIPFSYNDSVDLTLIIDQSGSMAGKKMELVKNATKALVSLMYADDRISVIRFSDSAFFVNRLADDKELLVNQIDQISATGSTLYIPALEKAEEGYNMSDKRNKVVIFFSDGEPWDSGRPKSIYTKVQELVDKGICVYAIGYGNEIANGSYGEMVLKHIVDISRNSSKCGRYVYSPEEEGRLAKIFGTVYNEGKMRIKGLDVVPKLSRSSITENENVIITAKVKSSFNGNYLPGYSEELGLCAPPAKVTAIFRNSKNRTAYTEELTYVGDTNGYQAEVSGLKSGEYNVEIYAQAACQDDSICSYEGSGFARLNVEYVPKFSANPYFLIIFTLVVALFIALMFRKGRLKSLDEIDKMGILSREEEMSDEEKEDRKEMLEEKKKWEKNRGNSHETEEELKKEDDEIFS